MHGLVCAVKHVVTKQVSRGQVYVQSCVLPSESYPTLCLLGGRVGGVCHKKPVNLNTLTR